MNSKKTKLLTRILCIVLAGIMILGVISTIIMLVFH